MGRILKHRGDQFTLMIQERGAEGVGPKKSLMAVEHSRDIPHRNIIIFMIFPSLMGNLKIRFKGFRVKFFRGPDLDKMSFGRPNPVT